MNTEPYLRARQRTSLDLVTFGHRTVRFLNPDELDEAQIGYRTASDGDDLTGKDPGAWQSEWLVVAEEDEMGDPIFVDTSDPVLPVYTAVHGVGLWEAEQVADSFEGFVRALSAVASVSAGRDSPVALEQNPLRMAERERVLQEIAATNPDSDPYFWESWLGEPEE